MNARHAATLALVGWYLMLPPIGLGGLPNEEAPLLKWHTIASYDTAPQCHDFQEKAVGAENDQKYKKMWQSGACIETADPRLAR